MKISPVSSPANTVGGVEGAAPSVRSVRLTTNATPGRLDIPAQVEELPPAVVKPAQDSAISDTSEDKAPETEATKPLSPQFAALAKERRALQQERKAFEAEKLSHTEASKSSVTMDQLKADPLGVLLDRVGLSYDDLTKAVMSRQDGISPKVQSLETKIDALEKGLEQKFQEKEQQAEQQAIAGMRKEALDLSGTGDDYAYVRETGSVDKVIDFIVEKYRETGEVIAVKVALQKFEDYFTKEQQRLSALKKAPESPALAPASPPQPARPQGMRTLTNKDTASVPLTPKQRALMAFNGTLKK